MMVDLETQKVGEKDKVSDKQEALHGSGSITLSEILLVVTFAAGFALMLYMLFGRVFASSVELAGLRQLASLALLAGMLAWLLFSATKPQLVYRAICHQRFLIGCAIGSLPLSIILVWPLEPGLAWIIALMLSSLIVGAILGLMFILFINGLTFLPIARVMLVSVLGVTAALVLYLLLENLNEPVAFVSILLLPMSVLVASAFMFNMVRHGSGGQGKDDLGAQAQAQATGARYARMTLRQCLDGNEKTSTNTPLLSMSAVRGIREKSLGLLVYGFTGGTAIAVLLQTLSEVDNVIGLPPWTMFGMELLLISILLAGSLQVFSVRSYLRLPQWSYYLITVIAFLFICNADDLLRLIFSGLNVAAAIYFFTVDITVLHHMGQDMNIDPRRNFGWYEGIYVGATILGWLSYLVLLYLLDANTAAIIMSSSCIAVVAAMMSLMRWLYYDSVSKNIAVTSSGEWKHRCETMGKNYNLTRRETEILEYLVRGRSMNYIKEQFVVSLSTVKTHINNVYRKVGVHSREQLIDLFEQSRNRKSS
jgi:DNA-binding CsgD family transcriptional regulator